MLTCFAVGGWCDWWCLKDTVQCPVPGTRTYCTRSVPVPGMVIDDFFQGLTHKIQGDHPWNRMFIALTVSASRINIFYRSLCIPAGIGKLFKKTWDTFSIGCFHYKAQIFVVSRAIMLFETTLRSTVCSPSIMTSRPRRMWMYIFLLHSRDDGTLAHWWLVIGDGRSS